MTFLERIVLAVLVGALRGICDVLPIDAATALSLLERLVALSYPGAVYDVPLANSLSAQAGVWLAVVVVIVRPLAGIVMNGARRAEWWSENRKVLEGATLAVLITLASGFCLLSSSGSMLSSTAATVLGFTLLNSMVVLTSSFLFPRMPPLGRRSLGDLRVTHWCAIGFVQAFAVFPGLSRIALTILISVVLRLRWSEILKLALIMTIALPIPAVLWSYYIEPLSTARLPDFMLTGTMAFSALVLASLAVRAALGSSLYAPERLSFFGLYGAFFAAFLAITWRLITP